MLPKVPEILAPAGGRAQFFAALNAGADAVYLGLKEFNARARAENFTVGDLRELVPLAHRYGMKVLVTVNVLIKDTELTKLVEELSALEELGVHAIIVQDLAVARLVKRFFPGLRLHASTQMAVHNLAGVRQAWRYGFRRVVLARELTALEIKRIRSAIPESEMELEAFCHGSLCYSYSGLCFFSGANDARSGNRGECAYTCRVPYKILNEPGHGFLFSMRDLDTSKDLAALIGTGVDTLKIEGRKKDAQYVSTVVKLYRNRLDEIYGKSTLREEAPAEARAKAREADLRGDLSLSFQRSPTTFFLKGRYYENVIDLDNPTHLGVRIGEIAKVFPEGTIRVHTEIPLERFDGLRVASSDRVFHAKPQHGEKNEGPVEAMVKKFQNEDVQFPLRELRIGGKWTPTARAGETVDIAWPEGRELPRRGDVLYKVRSADLKRRVLKLEAPPAEAKLKALSLVGVLVRITEAEDQLVIEAEVKKLAETLTRAELRVPKLVSRGTSTLSEDLEEMLGQFGDEGFLSVEVAVEGDVGTWFVPRSKLKALKNELGRELASRYQAFIDERKARAVAGVKGASPKPELADAERFAIKLDRLEAVADLSAFLERHPEFPAAEIVFEPKRAFLPALDPASLVESLKAFETNTKVPVRLALPMVIRAWDEPLLRRWLTTARENGLSRFEAGNLGALELLDEWALLHDGTDLTADFTLYALNAEASRFWAERGIRQVALSVEDDLKNLSSHLGHWPWESGIRPQAILFKDTPLFIAEACSLTALHNGCPTAKVCGYRTLEIENPAGERFYVAHESCKSIVYAKEAYSITQKKAALRALGIRDFRVDFLTRPYDREAMETVLRAAWNGSPIPGTHSANFDRTLL